MRIGRDVANRVHFVMGRSASFPRRELENCCLLCCTAILSADELPLRVSTIGYMQVSMTGIRGVANSESTLAHRN